MPGADRRRLDVELVRVGFAPSRTKAAEMITAGRVRLDGVVVRRSGENVADRTVSVATDAEPDYASRGGHKLADALAELPELTISGRTCLDAGASTGGFTDVLLRTGAVSVLAVDVGTGQLVPRLRDDPRVRVLDGRNVRALTALDIGGAVDVCVADLSFISLTLVLPALMACTADDGDLLVMVKPQFEVGRERLGAGGVVRDAAHRRGAVLTVARAAQVRGWGTRAVVRSSLPGHAGNVEFFLWLRRDAPVVDEAVLDGAVLGV